MDVQSQAYLWCHNGHLTTMQLQAKFSHTFPVAMMAIFHTVGAQEILSKSVFTSSKSHKYLQSYEISKLAPHLICNIRILSNKVVPMSVLLLGAVIWLQRVPILILNISATIRS